jgi:hypothetical protein
VVCKYIGILFDLDKEWSSDICYSMDETSKLYAKLKKLDTKG